MKKMKILGPRVWARSCADGSGTEAWETCFEPEKGWSRGGSGSRKKHQAPRWALTPGMTPQHAYGVPGVSARRSVRCFFVPYPHPLLVQKMFPRPGLSPRSKTSIPGLLDLDPRPLVDPWKTHRAGYAKSGSIEPCYIMLHPGYQTSSFLILMACPIYESNHHRCQTFPIIVIKQMLEHGLGSAIRDTWYARQPAQYVNTSIRSTVVCQYALPFRVPYTYFWGIWILLHVFATLW